MEAVALNALGIESAWNRQQPRYSGHSMVKRRVETCDLRQIRITLAERFEESDLLRQMVRIVWADATQFIEQFLCYQRRFGVLHSVDHAMAHSTHGIETNVRFKPIEEGVRRREMIGVVNVAAAIPARVRIVECQAGAGLADSIDVSIEPSLQPFAGSE